MTLLGKTIQMKGLSQKGKNRIRDHGDRWTVFAETDRVLFSPSIPGPWLFVSPVGLSHGDKSSRWVKLHGDLDFAVAAVD